MNIAILHPQCRVRGGAIKMALLTAQSLKNQGHKVVFYTFEHDSECFPELQEGLTIVTGKTTQKNKNEEKRAQMNNEEGIMNNEGIRHGEQVVGSDNQGNKGNQQNLSVTGVLDTVDKRVTFWGFFSKAFPRFSSIVGIAWDIRQVDIVIANNPPMQIVGALAKVFSFFSSYHQRLAVIWWHHHIPWYYTPKYKVQNTKYKIIHFFSPLFWKSLFERHWILPRVKYLVATSYYTAFCIEKYCGRKAIVIHPVIMKNEKGKMKNEGSSSDNQGNKLNQQNQINSIRPVVLFTHGRLEPGKGLDTLVKVWKELQEIQNTKDKVQSEGIVGSGNLSINPSNEINLIIAGDGSLKNWLIEQGATVIPYYEGLLMDIQMKNEEKRAQMNNEKGIMNNEGIRHGEQVVGSDNKGNQQNQGNLGDSDILAIYLSTIDAFGMTSLEAQIAGFNTIILDKGGARETVLLDNNQEPQAQLIDTESEIVPAITYFIQQRTLHKRVSNVNFCHQREYFTMSRLDADIRSLIDSVR